MNLVKTVISETICCKLERVSHFLVLKTGHPGLQAVTTSLVADKKVLHEELDVRMLEQPFSTFLPWRNP
jgi:hypothetical protein